jgi:cytochrome c peroxidase
VRRLLLPICRILSVIVVGVAASCAGWFCPELDAQSPYLPHDVYDYVTYAVTNLPEHYLPSPPYGDVPFTDNTPDDNPITNDGATLGRVLFYDKRLSINQTISCASCHTQETGFSDVRRYSIGHSGIPTPRHSPGLSNAKYYERGRFRWDETALTLEQQCIIPIVALDEMGMTMPELRQRLESTTFYPRLFKNAFGDPAVTNDRIAKSMAQFIRSMVSYHSKFDLAFERGTDGFPNFDAVYDLSESLGQQLFMRGNDNISLKCDSCHKTAAFVLDEPHNIGLDPDNLDDEGAGDGKFKVPSLRNIAVRTHFMHDGRFSSLEEVVEFYSTGIQDNPFLDALLREGGNPDNPPLHLNLTKQEIIAITDFLETLTDYEFLSDKRFSDPFLIPPTQLLPMSPGPFRQPFSTSR